MVSESSVGPAMAVAAFLQGPKKICQEDGVTVELKLQGTDRVHRSYRETNRVYYKR